MITSPRSVMSFSCRRFQPYGVEGDGLWRSGPRFLGVAYVGLDDLLIPITIVGLGTVPSELHARDVGAIM